MGQSAVDRSDIATGRKAVVFASTAAANSAGSLLSTQERLIPRGVTVTSGTLTVTLLDGTSITLPDMGAWMWPLQFKAITAGTGVNIVVIY